METNPTGTELVLQNDNVNVAEIQSSFSSTVFRIPYFDMNDFEQRNWGKHSVVIEYGSSGD